MNLPDLQSAVALYHKGNAMRAYALKVIHDDEMYLEGEYDSFKEFVEDGLKISESGAHRLLRYARFLESVGLDIWTAEAIPSEGAVRSMVSEDNAEELYQEALEIASGDPGKITKRVADEVTGTRNKSNNRKKPPKKPSTTTTADRLREVVYDHHTRLCPDGKAHDFIRTFGQHPMFSQQLNAEIQNAEAVMKWIDDYARNLRAYTRTTLQAA